MATPNVSDERIEEIVSMKPVPPKGTVLPSFLAIPGLKEWAVLAPTDELRWRLAEKIKHDRNATTPQCCGHCNHTAMVPFEYARGMAAAYDAVLGLLEEAKAAAK